MLPSRPGRFQHERRFLSSRAAPQGVFRRPLARPPAAAWRRDQKRLGESLDELLRALASRTEADLERTGGSLSDRDPALGTGVTRRAMINGLVRHNAYHSGQLTLLRKALRTGS